MRANERIDSNDLWVIESASVVSCFHKSPLHFVCQLIDTYRCCSFFLSFSLFCTRIIVITPLREGRKEEEDEETHSPPLQGTAITLSFCHFSG